MTSDSIVIELSDYAKTFLETTEISISSNNIKLEENQRIFAKFNDIHVEENRLSYSSLEIYKYTKEIEVDDIKKDYFVWKNNYGNFMKVDGISFKYKSNIYFKSDYELSEKNEIYFINIKNEVLLIEEIKSLIFPFKIYNIINPQETHFNEMIEIYMKKE